MSDYNYTSVNRDRLANELERSLRARLEVMEMMGKKKVEEYRESVAGSLLTASLTLIPSEAGLLLRLPFPSVLLFLHGRKSLGENNRWHNDSFRKTGLCPSDKPKQWQAFLLKTKTSGVTRNPRRFGASAYQAW